MNQEQAHILADSLRSRFIGGNLNDFELIERAIDRLPTTSDVALFFVVAYYQIREVSPPHALWIFLGGAALFLITCVYLRRERRKLETVRSIFTLRAPKTISEAFALANKGE